MAGHGGRRANAGRKTKSEEFKANVIIAGALKKLYSVDTDLEAKEQLIHKLASNTRGQIFLAEHLFGKPQQNSNINIANFDNIEPTFIKWAKTE